MQSSPTEINRKLALQVGFTLFLITLIYSFYCIFIVNPQFEKVEYDTNIKVGRALPPQSSMGFVLSKIEYNIEGLYFDLAESTIKREYLIPLAGLSIEHKDTFLLNTVGPTYSFTKNVSNSIHITKKEHQYYYDQEGHYHLEFNLCELFLVKGKRPLVTGLTQSDNFIKQVLLNINQKSTDTLNFASFRANNLDIQFSLCYSIDYKHYEGFAVPTLSRSYFVDPNKVKNYSNIKVQESGSILDTVYYRDLKLIYSRSADG